MNLSVTLLAIFVALKLVGVLTWSWLWVLSPLWLPALVWIVVWGSLLAFAHFTGENRDV